MSEEMWLEIRRQMRGQKIDQALIPIRDAEADRIERELLCDLWRDLGDNTETYWQAMTAVAAYVKIDRFIFREMDTLPHAVRIRVQEAIARTILAKVEANKQIHAKRAEIIAANPLPGDHA